MFVFEVIDSMCVYDVFDFLFVFKVVIRYIFSFS